MIYLTKFLAQAGVASRRKSEDLIRAGRVKINGERAEIGVMVEGDEEITVSGRVIDSAMANKRLVIAFNKPIGYTCTTRSFVNEENIFSLLPERYKNLIIAGRLDKESRGLILLTNDGDLAYKLTHPRFGHDKKYLVRLAGEDRMELTEGKLYARAKDGIRSEDGEMLTAKSIRREEDRWAVTLSEGKKRHIRRLFAGMGLKVTDLQRVNIGEMGLGGLPQGSYRELSDKDIKKLIK